MLLLFIVSNAPCLMLRVIAFFAYHLYLGEGPFRVLAGFCYFFLVLAVNKILSKLTLTCITIPITQRYLGLLLRVYRSIGYLGPEPYSLIIFAVFFSEHRFYPIPKSKIASKFS